MLERKNNMPRTLKDPSEAREDILYRQYRGELSKFVNWDILHSDEYTEEDKKIDKEIDHAN